MPYEVRTAVFEGPFDLLLHLIVRDQVDLYEISLAEVIDAYLVELDRLLAPGDGVDGPGAGLDLDVATEFLLIAATLVELKARRLLPGVDDPDVNDELGLWEERDLLLAKLLELKTFKDAAGALARLGDAAARSFPRTAGLEERFVALTPDLLAGVTGADLRRAFVRVTTSTPAPTVDLSHLHVSAASVADAVAELLDELPRAGRISFRRLTGGLVERLEVVVRFLAVLELCKQGLVDLEQASSLAVLVVVWLGDGAGDTGSAGDLAELALAGADAYDG